MHIELIDILMIMVLLGGTYGLFRELNRKKYEGDLLLVVPKDWEVKAIIGFWIVFGCFWLYLNVEIVSSTAEYFADYPIRRVFTPGIVVFSVLLNLVRANISNEVRQKGVHIREVFIGWKDIISYKWGERDRLEIVVRQKIPFLPEWKTTKLWVVEESYRDRVEEIFQRYVHENSDSFYE